MLTALHEGIARVRVGDDELIGGDLTGAAGAVARNVGGADRVAVVARPTLHTVVAVAGALAAGATVVPMVADTGERERAHVLHDCQPEVLLDTYDVDLTARADLPGPEKDHDRPALIVYTSGTTGPPKGAVIPRRAVSFDLDALADAWQWSHEDVLVHALPLFHVHGLVLGVLGPLRIGSPLVRRDAFRPHPGGSIYFGVPTMWSRIGTGELAALASARLLVSGSAALPMTVFDRVKQFSGHELVQRYGLTETLINTAARVERARRPACVGPPLPGVDVKLQMQDGGDAIGEVMVRGPNVFSGYLHRPPDTDADGWFRTGDLAAWDDDELRLLGRQSTDLIKTGGHKVGAGEVEDALLAHPAVGEAAVVGEPDDDLGQRIVAYVVPVASVTTAQLVAHVTTALPAYKRPRDVRFVDTLPRNAMGKVQKTLLSRGER